MRLTPKSGILIGGTREEPEMAPPLPFLEVEDTEAGDLIARGLAKEFGAAEDIEEIATGDAAVNPEPEPVVESLVSEAAEPVTEPEAAEPAATEQASVGAEGAASGEAAPAAASEATSVSEDAEPHGDAPADTPEEDAKLKDLADHIELLTEDDFVKTGPRAGKPKVAPLAAALGLADLTAEEVDAAFALHEAAKAAE